MGKKVCPNHRIKKFTRLDPDTLACEFTVIMPLRRTDVPLFEYACHAGNIGLHGILAGAPAQKAKGIPLRK